MLRLRDVSARELESMYKFCSSLMEESKDGFMNHTKLCDLAYLFQERSRKTRQAQAQAHPQEADATFGSDPLVGVSLWRVANTRDARVKIILQGKLRIRADYR